jgi:hypothetical protein
MKVLFRCEPRQAFHERFDARANPARAPPHVAGINYKTHAYQSEYVDRNTSTRLDLALYTGTQISIPRTPGELLHRSLMRRVVAQLKSFEVPEAEKRAEHLDVERGHSRAGNLVVSRRGCPGHCCPRWLDAP